MDSIVLIGAGGHAKVIIDIIRSIRKYKIVGITDKDATGSVMGIPIIGSDEELPRLFTEGVEYAFICVGAVQNPELREAIYCRAKRIGYKFPTLIHEKAIVSQTTNIGVGTCVMAGAIINPGVQIGKNCIINTGSIIEHDCIIKDNVHISPGAMLAGGVQISKGTHIGLGSAIIQGKRIGKNVTIGAGAVVVGDIEDDVIAVGIPAKIIRNKKNI